MKKDLPNTLAGRVQYLRELNNLSKEQLATSSNLQLSIINDIEEGRDIFLSVTVRQKLSKALRVSLNTIKEVEKKVSNIEYTDQDVIDNIKFNILSGKLEGHNCPKCNNPLICKTVTLRDLEDNPVIHPKARCKKCPFQIK